MLASELALLATVIVCDGVGVIGLKHAHTLGEIAAGAIPWHVAHLYPLRTSSPKPMYR